MRVASASGGRLVLVRAGHHAEVDEVTSCRVIPGTIWRWVRNGLVSGWQVGEGTPWHISLPESEVARLRARLARTRTQRMKRSGRPAS